jgi:hypothetical protein
MRADVRTQRYVMPPAPFVLPSPARREDIDLLLRALLVTS